MSDFQDFQEVAYADFSDPIEVSHLEVIKAGQFEGITGELSNDQYHAVPGLSFSGLKDFSKTPAHYQAYLRKENEETPARRIGTGVHMRVLEPEKFGKTVVTVENRTAKGNKEIIATAEAEGKWILTTKEYDKICRMGEAALKDPLVKNLLVGGVAEQSVFWRDPKTGILLKCRPDYLRPDGVVIDLKTFDDLDDLSLMKQVHNMKYHWQSQLYLTGVNRVLRTASNMFAHVFIQTDDPYLTRVVVLNDASLEKAQFDMDPLLEQFARCQLLNEWPGYAPGISEIALPDWAWR